MPNIDIDLGENWLRAISKDVLINSTCNMGLEIEISKIISQSPRSKWLNKIVIALLQTNSNTFWAAIFNST